MSFSVMRGLVLALLLVAPLLSGCLYLQPPGTVEPLETTGVVQHLPLPEVRAATGAQGFWIPGGADRLTMEWNRTAAPPEDDADDDPKRGRVHDDLPSGVLSHFDDLLIVLGPDGERLHVGTPSIRLYTATSDGHAPGNATAANASLPAIPKNVFLDLADPAPGLYTLVTLGDIPLPRILLHGSDSRALPPLTPLPVTVTRTTLLGNTGPAAGPLDGSGTLTLAPRTVAVWGDLRGIGGQARLLFESDGDTAAQTARTAFADPTTGGIDDLSIGLTRFFDDWSSDPAALRTTELTWRLQGSGTGIAYAYAAVVGDLAAPAARLAAEDGEVTPLEGRLEPGDAGGFVLPRGARLLVQHADDSRERYDHARYRVYDINGARLHTGATAGTATALSLPPGPLAIVNDGPGKLQVAVVGTAPDDAVLHPLETVRDTIRTSLGSPGAGPSETRLRVTLDGPLVGAYESHVGTLEDLYVQIHREHDDAPLMSLPDLARYGPHDTYCCGFAFFGGAGSSTSSVDPGIQRIRLRSEAGHGDITLDLYRVDLDGFLELQG